MNTLLDKRKFYIDGTWVDPVRANDLEVIDPSTEEPVAVISLGDQADTDAAVAAAKRAFPAWSRTSPADRLAHVEKILEVYKSRAKDMAWAISHTLSRSATWMAIATSISLWRTPPAITSRSY